jgi:hypothetical protein
VPRALPPLPPLPPENLRSVAHNLVRSAASGSPAVYDRQLRKFETGLETGAAQLAGTAELIAEPFGPDHFETECGIKVRGARIVDFFAPRAAAELLGDAGNILRIGCLDQHAVSVLIRIAENVGIVIPAIPGFIAGLTFDDGELIDVAYEPSRNTWRWDPYNDRAAGIRALRAIAASASQHVQFRLDQADALLVAKRMQYAKGVDPTLAIYAAYAYHDLQAIDRIRDMSAYLRNDVGVTFFDLALLGRVLLDRTIGPDDRIVPFVPLLSQGWTFLRAHRVKLHPALAGIDRTMQDSLWSLFDAAGLDKLRQAMQTMEVR